MASYEDLCWDAEQQCSTCQGRVEDCAECDAYERAMADR